MFDLIQANVSPERGVHQLGHRQSANDTTRAKCGGKGSQEQTEPENHESRICGPNGGEGLGSQPRAPCVTFRPSWVSFPGPWTVPRSSLRRVSQVIVVCSAPSFVCAWGPVLSLLRLWLVLRGPPSPGPWPLAKLSCQKYPGFGLTYPLAPQEQFVDGGPPAWEPCFYIQNALKMGMRLKMISVAGRSLLRYI